MDSLQQLSSCPVAPRDLILDTRLSHYPRTPCTSSSSGVPSNECFYPSGAIGLQLQEFSEASGTDLSHWAHQIHLPGPEAAHGREVPVSKTDGGSGFLPASAGAL
ncbi:hypothetical protein Y1Q_0017265 [Alligator mississippiensis]|uniref:Uncharacterized protein n=1 Tax=Alligator mississippiensis TaxID=8496 RepID=A0A151NLV5_ALLMI|nr:hypothetical protein Y1Q_0017265 [Alligator mississippiensis]